MYSLGEMHATGTGTSRNCELATGLFKNVAERGIWAKMLTQAYDAYEEDRTDAAALMYMFLGELGFEMAQNNAAYILDETHDEELIFDVNGSLGRALAQWKRSADQGFNSARLKIGDYHFYGNAVPEDHSVAANEYRLAADSNNAQAMFNLGWMHEYGVGLPVDLHLAKRYYDQAAETSHDAQIPSAIALTGVQFKMWVHANFGELGLNEVITDLMKTTDELHAMTLDEILSEYENTMIGGLMVMLVILLLARKLQQQQQEERARVQAEQILAAAAAAAAAAENDEEQRTSPEEPTVEAQTETQ